LKCLAGVFRGRFLLFSFFFRPPGLQKPLNVKGEISFGIPQPFVCNSGMSWLALVVPVLVLLLSTLALFRLGPSPFFFFLFPGRFEMLGPQASIYFFAPLTVICILARWFLRFSPAAFCFFPRAVSTSLLRSVYSNAGFGLFLRTFLFLCLAHFFFFTDFPGTQFPTLGPLTVTPRP